MPKNFIPGTQHFWQILARTVIAPNTACRIIRVGFLHFSQWYRDIIACTVKSKVKGIPTIHGADFRTSNYAAGFSRAIRSRLSLAAC